MATETMTNFANRETETIPGEASRVNAHWKNHGSIPGWMIWAEKLGLMLGLRSKCRKRAASESFFPLAVIPWYGIHTNVGHTNTNQG